jgi:hypothetical protein
MSGQMRVLGFIAITICVLFSARYAVACTCFHGGGKTMRESAALDSDGPKAAKIIFQGLVQKQDVVEGAIGAPSNAMSMTGYGSHRVVTMQVSYVYRGQAEGTVTLITGLGGGDCGFDFEVGQEYLVYANSITGGRLFTSICTGTAPLEQAAAKVRFLRGELPLEDDLLSPEKYYAKYQPKWTGKVCGRALRPDGSPLGKAMIDMSRIRDEALPLATVSDPDLSKPDGSFCVAMISPGKYLLTAEEYDYDANFRWMGYYPGVARHSEAIPIEVKAGTALHGVEFRVQKQSLFTVRFRIKISDGSALPWKNLGITIARPDHDPLAYHESHGIGEDGGYTLGLIPSGHYFVSSFIEPDFDTHRVAEKVSKLQMVKEEVDIHGNAEIILELPPQK